MSAHRHRDNRTRRWSERTLMGPQDSPVKMSENVYLYNTRALKNTGKQKQNFIKTMQQNNILVTIENSKIYIKYKK